MTCWAYFNFVIFKDDKEAEAGDKGDRLSSPRVSGSGQVDSEDTEAIKAEAETKPIVKEAAANTVKSGEKSRMMREYDRAESRDSKGISKLTLKQPIL